MNLEAFKKTLWGSVGGTIVSIGELNDGHLLNVIRHTTKFSWQYGWDYIRNLRAVAEERGLTPRGPTIPWQDTDGKWKTFDPTINANVEVSKP